MSKTKITVEMPASAAEKFRDPAKQAELIAKLKADGIEVVSIELPEKEAPMGRSLGNPEDWSDADKLRLLADVIEKGHENRPEWDDRHTVESDLRRIADDLDLFSADWRKREAYDRAVERLIGSPFMVTPLMASIQRAVRKFAQSIRRGGPEFVAAAESWERYADELNMCGKRSITTSGGHTDGKLAD